MTTTITKSIDTIAHEEVSVYAFEGGELHLTNRLHEYTTSEGKFSGSWDEVIIELCHDGPGGRSRISFSKDWPDDFNAFLVKALIASHAVTDATKALHELKDK